MTDNIKEQEHENDERYKLTEEEIKQEEAKRKELEDATLGKAKKAADDAVNSAKDKAKDAAKSKLKGLF